MRNLVRKVKRRTIKQWLIWEIISKTGEQGNWKKVNNEKRRKEERKEEIQKTEEKNRIASAVKRVEFVSDRVSYIVLRGRWCNIVFLNVHVPREEKNDGSKDSFYEE